MAQLHACYPSLSLKMKLQDVFSIMVRDITKILDVVYI